MAQFDIVYWLGNRTGYGLSREALEVIVIERGLQGVEDYSELEQRDKDLLLADVLFYIWTSPTQTGSTTRQHGDFSYTVGTQIMTDKSNIYAMMMSLYRKWGDSKAELAESLDTGGCKWVD